MTYYEQSDPGHTGNFERSLRSEVNYNSYELKLKFSRIYIYYTTTRNKISLQLGDLLIEQVRQSSESYGVICFNVDDVLWAILSYRPTLWLVPLAHKVANRSTTSCTLVLVLVFPESN